MTVRTDERRISTRLPAGHQVAFRDTRGRVIGRGRTANISEGGIMVIVRRSHSIPQNGSVVAEVTVPANPATGTKRRVRYRCRIARRLVLGNMLGLGLEFIEKIV